MPSDFKEFWEKAKAEQKEFPLTYTKEHMTIAASTVLSGFNSLTLTPALCALFLEKSKPSNFLIYKGVNKAYDKTQGAYDKIVKWLLARPGMALVSYEMCIRDRRSSRVHIITVDLILS